MPRLQHFDAMREVASRSRNHTRESITWKSPVSRTVLDIYTQKRL
jgi:hypothetical protein